MLIINGEALSTPNRFQGTSVEVRFDCPVEQIIDVVTSNGFEHHYSLVWSNVSKELAQLCSMFDVPVIAT